MAWSDSGQVTQSILGIKGMQQQKKNDRWSKLMDIANVLQNTAGLGADLWKTVSGRKYQTGERLGAQDFAAEQAALGREHDVTMADIGQEHAKEQFDWRAKFDAEEAQKDRTWQEGQNALDRELRDRIATLDRAAQTQGRAEQRTSFLAEWAQRAYELAISNPSFLGPDGAFDPSKREALRKFLYTQVDGLPNLSGDEITWVKKSFDGFVDALGSTTIPTTAEAVKIVPPPPATELLAKAKETASLLAQMALPPEVKKEVNTLYGWLPGLGSPGGRGPAGVSVQDILSKLTTIYNTYKYRDEGGGTGQAQGDLRVIK